MPVRSWSITTVGWDPWWCTGAIHDNLMEYQIPEMREKKKMCTWDLHSCQTFILSFKLSGQK